jgi:hypothetical protein
VATWALGLSLPAGRKVCSATSTTNLEGVSAAAMASVDGEEADKEESGDERHEEHYHGAFELGEFLASVTLRGDATLVLTPAARAREWYWRPLFLCIFLPPNCSSSSATAIAIGRARQCVWIR